MTTSDIPDSVWEGTFRLFGVDVRCHILSDGRRVIESESMRDLFEAMEGEGDVDAMAALDGFVRWVKGMDAKAEAAQ